MRPKDIAETAHTLRCSVVTVRRYVRRGELRASLVGGRLLFADDDIAAFVRGRRVQPAAAPA